MMRPIATRRSMALTATFVVAVLALAPGASARMGDQPSEASSILWAHVDADFNYWMSTVQDGDPDHEGTAGFNPLVWVLGPAEGADALVAQWSIAMDPALTAPLSINPQRDIEFRMYFSSTTTVQGNAVPQPTHAKVQALLLMGATEVVNLSTPAAAALESAPWTEVVLAGSPAVDTLVSGQPISWIIRATVEPPFAGSIFLGMEPDHWSRLSLPIGVLDDGGTQAGALELVSSTSSAEARAGSEATYELTIRNAGGSDASYSLSALGLPEGFEASFDPATGDVSAGQEAGSQLTISIPQEASPGVVDFSVVVSDANGASAEIPLTLTVVPATGPTPSSTTPSASPTDSTSSATQTTEAGGPAGSEDPEPEEKKGLPGFELVALAGALMAVLLVRRRRTT